VSPIFTPPCSPGCLEESLKFGPLGAASLGGRDGVVVCGVVGRGCVEVSGVVVGCEGVVVGCEGVDVSDVVGREKEGKEEEEEEEEAGNLTPNAL
jgi:hypothetical protein